MSRLRVLHVEVGGAWGGSLRALELYLRHADRRRMEHDLWLYYPTPGAEEFSGLCRNLEILFPAPPARARGRGRFRLPLRRLARRFPAAAGAWQLARSLPLAWRLWRRLRAAPYDLVHINNTFTYQPATLLAARMARVPVAAHLRNPVPGHWLERRLAALAALLIPIHSGQERQLQAWPSPPAIARCPDAVALAPASPVRVHQLRRRFCGSYGPGAPLIGSLGRLEPQKDYACLVEAAAAVLREFPRARFIVAGEGPDRPALEAAIHAHGLQANFSLIGFCPEPENFLGALDLYVSSSRWEGLPLAVLEAIAAGVPVVATRAGATAEVVTPNQTGWLAPVHAPAELAACIAAALRRPERTRHLAEQARSRLAAFSPVHSAARLDAAFLQAASTVQRVRSFYEDAYGLPAWQRQQLQPDHAPGARFSKMWYRAAMRELLPALPLRGARILEVGAGYGYLASWLLAQGAASYVATDVAASGLSQLPRLPRCHAALADGGRLPFAARQFDLVICMEVLEHAPDPEKLLDECMRVLRPEGCLLLSSPNYCNLFLPLKWLADCGLPACRRYLRRQILDRTLFAFGVRAQLLRRGEILQQRAVRLHPPLFEQFDRRFAAGHPLVRLNDFLFAWERRHGGRAPWRYFGLHTCFLARPAAQPAAAAPELERTAA